MQYAYHNGSLVRAKDLHLHFSDLAIHRAYGVFDFFKLVEGSNPWMEWYLDRFFNSLSHAQLSISESRKDLRDIVNNILEKNGQPDSCIKLLCTGGYSPDGFTPQNKSNFLVLNYPWKSLPVETYEHGATLITREYRRSLPSVKSIDYFYSISLLPEMKKKGAIDVLYHMQGEISETSRSNIFVVNNGTVFTPEKHVLEGITRKRLLSLDPSYNIRTGEIELSELYNADEVFISSTMKGVMPVTKIDDQSIGSGLVGKITRQLMHIIHEF